MLIIPMIGAALSFSHEAVLTSCPGQLLVFSTNPSLISFCLFIFFDGVLTGLSGLQSWNYLLKLAGWPNQLKTVIVLSSEEQTNDCLYIGPVLHRLSRGNKYYELQWPHRDQKTAFRSPSLYSLGLNIHCCPSFKMFPEPWRGWFKCPA